MRSVFTNEIGFVIKSLSTKTQENEKASHRLEYLPEKGFIPKITKVCCNSKKRQAYKKQKIQIYTPSKKICKLAGSSWKDAWHHLSLEK